MNDLKTWLIFGTTFIGTSITWYFTLWNKINKNKNEMEKTVEVHKAELNELTKAVEGNKELILSEAKKTEAVLKAIAKLTVTIENQVMINILEPDHPVRIDIEDKLRKTYIVK